MPQQAQTVQDVMTTDLATCPSDTSLVEAAKIMRDRDVGDVLVTEQGRLRGIVTDRDLVVRCLADGKDPSQARLGDACSTDVVTATPSMSVDDAAQLMAENAIRRVPVVDGDRPVGIVSLGDLAVERDPASVLGDISAAPPDN